MRALFALLIAFFVTPTVFAAELHLDFRTFQVRTHFTEAAAPLRWDENIFPYERAFEYTGTSYVEMSLQPHRRFGGHYVMVTTGCGLALQCGVLVDRLTGRVVSQLPLATSGYDYRFNSALLVVNPTNPEILANRDSYWEQTTYYYAWTTTGWQEVAREPWPTATLTEAEKIQAALFGDNGTREKTRVEPETFLDLGDRDIPIPLPRPYN